MGAAARSIRPLPLDAPLSARIHLLSLTAAEEHLLDLLVQELARFLVSGIQPVVVDQQGLMLQPLLPAGRTDALQDSLAEVVLERWATQWSRVFAAPMASDSVHGHLS